MSERSRSIRRVLKLQGKLSDLAAFRLARAEGEKAAVEANLQALQAYVDRSELTGPLALLAATQTRALHGAVAAAEERRKEQAILRQRAETRLKLAERVGEGIARSDAAAAERRALERLIEDAVARAASTPPET